MKKKTISFMAKCKKKAQCLKLRITCIWTKYVKAFTKDASNNANKFGLVPECGKND